MTDCYLKANWRFTLARAHGSEEAMNCSTGEDRFSALLVFKRIFADRNVS
jgi:hypothetical protein